MPQPKSAPSRPTIGRIVIFEDQAAPVPAIVTATTDTVQDHHPRLDSPTHLHLTVFTPGGAASARWNVPQADASRPNTWHWPSRA